MPQAAYLCYSVLFNRNILISGRSNKDLLVYLIDINSFSAIDYDFGTINWKILINIGRLYLIDSCGYIYESEDEYNLRRVSDALYSFSVFSSFYSYNKGWIYIATNRLQQTYDGRYVKFDLSHRVAIKF